jgi:transcriptional regulator with XRE-family HTH domain
MISMSEAFSDQLRRAIQDSGMTRYAISVQTGIDQAVLSKFMAGKIGLSLDSVNKLMDLLGLEIRPRRKRKGE